MELIRVKNSRNIRINHLIFLDPIDPSTFASSLLLREYYRSIQDPEDWQHDWRYYFIVRRHWLRKQRVNGVWFCHYCNKPIYKMPERNNQYQSVVDCVTVDHKIPVSKCEDKTDTSNFLVSCFKCNNEKRELPYDMFIQKISWASKNQKIA